MSNNSPSPDSSNSSGAAKEKSPSMEKSSNAGKKILTILAIIFALLIFAAGVAGASWFVFQKMESDNAEQGEEEQEDGDDQGEDEDEDEDEGESQVEMESFTGEYITGEHPEGWTIIEYVDGAYADMLVDFTGYVGVTGLEIKKPNNQTVFDLKAVHGIGGMGGCDDYYEFSDSSQSYYNDMLAESQAVGINMTTVDLTNSTYSEFTFFGTPVRRIGMDMYYDTDTTNNSFDAACGINEQFWWLDGLQYQADGMSTSGYEVELTGNLTDAEFEMLEDILGSLVVL